MKDPENNAFTVTRVARTINASDKQLTRVAQILEETEGLLEVRVGREGRLHIRYDASHIGFGDIERLLDNVDIALPRSAGWWLKSAWYRFLDQNAQTNATAKGGACCSNPTDILSKRRRD